tara:strand:- start:1272 stop:1496 length:225 start_codon:yes stop_codon:yes gene_type:complete
VARLGHCASFFICHRAGLCGQCGFLHFTLLTVIRFIFFMSAHNGNLRDICRSFNDAAAIRAGFMANPRRSKGPT